MEPYLWTLLKLKALPTGLSLPVYNNYAHSLVSATSITNSFYEMLILHDLLTNFY